MRSILKVVNDKRIIQKHTSRRIYLFTEDKYMNSRMHDYESDHTGIRNKRIIVFLYLTECILILYSYI